jgi:hypothetical protein
VRPSGDGIALSDLLEELSSRFAWPVSAAELIALEEWESRTARLVRVRDSEGKLDVVLKIGKERQGSNPAARSARMLRLADVLAGAEGTASAAPIRGWLDDPPVICMDFVDGAGLAESLRAQPEERWTEVGERCGRTLGVIHQAELADPDRGREPWSRSWWQVRRAAQRLVVPKSKLNGIAELVTPVRPYSDFMTPNFRLSAEGEVYLIDPPAEEPCATAHRDIAWFLAQIGPDFDPHRRVIGRPVLAARKDALREAFLDGYTVTGPLDPRHGGHRWLIELFSAYRTMLIVRHLVRDRGGVAQALRELSRAAAIRARL